MDYDEFVKEVKDRAHLDSADDAVRITGIVLELLAERVSDEEANYLAAQLPKKLKYYLQEPRTKESFNLTEFFHRISEREGVGLEEATNYAFVVISVLCDAISPVGVKKILMKLPEDFEAFFRESGGGTIKRL